MQRRKNIWKQISAMSMAMCVTITAGGFQTEVAKAETDTNQSNEIVSDRENTDFKCKGDNELNASLVDNLRKVNAELGFESDAEDDGISLMQLEPISQNAVTPATGDIRTLVVMVDFSDVKFDKAFTEEYVQDLMFAEQDEENLEKFPFESLRAYYQRSSFGKLNVSGDVVNVHLSLTKDDYTTDENSDENSPEVTTDVWKALCEQGIDWQKYDSDNDHYVDSICMIVAGNAGAWASQWWSCCLFGNLEPIDAKDEYHVGKYAFCMENQMQKPDTIIHEFGHMLGLPDLYNSYNSSADEGINTSDMMCQNYGELNGLCRMLLGWLDESQIHIVKYGEDVSDLQLRSYAKTGDIALFMLNEGDDSLFSEYYMAEYYTPYGNDTLLDVAYWEKSYPSSYVRFFHVNAELSESGKYLAHDNYSTGSGDDCLLIRAVDKDSQYIHGDDMWETLYPTRRVWRAIFDRQDGIACGYVDGDEFTPYTTPSTNKYALDRGKNSPDLFSGLSITDIKCDEDYASFNVSYEKTANEAEPITLEVTNYDTSEDRKEIQLKANYDIYLNVAVGSAYVREKDTNAFVENVTIKTDRIWPGWYTKYHYHSMLMAVLTDEDKIVQGTEYELVFPEGMFATASGMKSEEIIVNTIIYKPDHVHTLEYVEAKAATCKNDGNIAYWYCKDCQSRYKDQEATEEIPYGNQVTLRDPNNHIGGTYVAGYVAPTETVDGYTGDTYCVGCDALLENGSVIPATGIVEKCDHSSVTFVSAIEATCQNEGNIEYWYCNDCDKKFKDKAATQELTAGEEIIAKNPTNHIGETYIKGAVEATETTDGYTGDTYCAGCDSLLAKGNVVPATGIDVCGHASLVKVSATEANCQNEGNIEYWYCNDCDKKFKDKAATQELTVGEEIIAKNPTNHIGETYVKGAVEATETADGYTGDTYCAGCNSILARGNVIPATGKNEPDDSNTDSGNAGGDNTGNGTTGDDSTSGGTTTGGSATETPGSGDTGNSGSNTDNSGAGNGTTGGTTGGSTSGNTAGSGSTGGGTAGGGSTGGAAAGGGAAVSGGSTGNVSTGASNATDEKKDDSKVDKKVTTNKDGSVKEVVKEKETSSKGKEVTVTTTTEKDKKGNVTSVTEKTKIDNIASDASATVTVKTDKKGSTTATASVEKKVASEKKTTTISSTMIEQIKEAAGTDVDITMTVKDENGNTKYKVKADTADLKAGKNLYLYKLNTKTGEYVMVNDKTYAVSDKGNVSVKLDNKGTYELVSATDAKKIEKKILATVQAKKTTASVKKGKKTSIALSSKLNMSNVKSITYSTDSKSVATVSKKGTVTAKGKGTTTIRATVTLKNGKTKTVKMKVTVK